MKPAIMINIQVGNKPVALSHGNGVPFFHPTLIRIFSRQPVAYPGERSI
ncbi:MAG: hypothetical protein JW913_00920 [Chitinispirillaceae bacterium]|nr:hypothetical protein [Chitinispirillaceae bacterium]